jgi:hypothetical protein
MAGNFIGTDVTGTKPLGNQLNGVVVGFGSSSNRIGTDGQSADNAGEGNVISCNGNDGEVVLMAGDPAPTQNNLIAGNLIGTDLNGNPIPGVIRVPGINVGGGSNNQIGGSPALANTIVDNAGVWVHDSATGISIRANRIYGSSDGLGIDLGPYSIVDIPNTPGGPHTGPNELQNYPVLSTAVAGSASRVLGTLNSTPNTTFTIDFYANDPDNWYGEGQYYLGSATVTTDGSGNVSFNVGGLAATTPGKWVSATATDPGGNTSEFALDVPVIQVATATTLTPSATTPLAGVDTVGFTAGVTGTIPGTGTPSGSVDFFDTTTNTDLGRVNLSAGAAMLSTSFLATGSHTIVATYSGDGSLLASTATTTVNVIPPASLSGMVFEDFNNDGQVDFGEQGIPGVPVAVTGTDDLGHAVSLSQTTDGAGTYVFLGLRPGTYTITETQQPTGYTPGIATVGTGGGTVSGAQFTGINLVAGEDAMNYNYGEQPAATGPIQQGQTAGIGFWNNKNGQALIKALNGGVGTQLGDWLAATFPHMFGALSGSNDLAGQSNASVASFFQSRFVVHGQKLDAQVLATALAVYVTDPTLDNTGVGTQYGFLVGGNGVATATYNVGSNGAAFGVANNTVMTVMDILLAADAQAVNGVLYNGDTAKRNMANNVFSAINQAGGI